ncbi:MAG: antitoxin [Actinobacteria bacterium]|nr:antitoxin [Actinomycetota bacterium]
MVNVKNQRAYLAEFIGSTLLVSAIVGSGTMGTQISRDSGVGLTLNAISVVAMLWILITTLGPISGAHFNPVVSLVMAYRKAISTTDAIIYIILQIVGAILGATLANLMFEKTLFEISKVDRSALANPAVTIGRIFTDSVVGIAPSSVLPFLFAQVVGGAIGLGLATVLKGK